MVIEEFDKVAVSEIVTFILNEVNNASGFFVGNEQCAIEATTPDYRDVLVILERPGDERIYRLAVSREA